ncbi:hypothetical protein BVRB_001580 [Beta vulgaris subsp. vulgaris]|uniref:Uncharacterized protein n=1 Tax=Beta vulgaris subsp. vulgaris TaxID=3555 RepID=A0A0J8B595_BETVV|nr:hypothetical protein BVRB_001580 [Beta vulgaris subsp. vulgaris]
MKSSGKNIFFPIPLNKVDPYGNRGLQPCPFIKNQ